MSGEYEQAPQPLRPSRKAQECCDYVNGMAERASAVGRMIITDPDALIEAAMTIEQYLTNGGTIAFDCKDSSRKFVRGK